ncbi:MAG: Ig-like domain-containing protein, partial [Firmicutes bacterium]|nr:Ig-like domain-containing protein [Bacillota bacterium]
MRKSFLTKAIVAVGVMVSTIALSFVITMAGTSTETYEYTVSPSTNTKDFFTASSSSISQTDFTTESLQTNGYVVPDRTPSLTVTSALKLNSNGYLSFSLSEGETAELTFYVGGKKDGKAYSTQVLKDNVKVATYPTSGKYDVDSVNKLTYSASGAGTYTIKQSASEQCLYYAKLVVTSQTSDEAGATLTASTNSINVGNSLQLTPKFTNFTATSGAYESNNLGVATVDENGLIRAISQGTATITYTANGVGTLDSSVTELTATFDVTVNDPYVSSATTWDFSEFTEQIDLEGTNFTTSYS